MNRDQFEHGLWACSRDIPKHVLFEVGTYFAGLFAIVGYFTLVFGDADGADYWLGILALFLWFSFSCWSLVRKLTSVHRKHNLFCHKCDTIYAKGRLLYLLQPRCLLIENNCTKCSAKVYW